MFPGQSQRVFPQTVRDVLTVTETERDGGGGGGTHGGQGQAEAGGLVLHLDLQLVQKSLDPLVLEALPTAAAQNTEGTSAFGGEKERHRDGQRSRRSVPAYSRDDVVHGLADDALDSLDVLLSHPLETDAERRLFGAPVISGEDTRLVSLMRARQTITFPSLPSTDT